MQLRRFLQLTACVLVLVGCSFANSVNDPKVIVGGLGGGPESEGIVTVHGNTFSFDTQGSSPPCTIDGAPDPTCQFINGNNYAWTTLTFFIDPVQGGLTCDGGSFFAHCSVNNELGIVSFVQCFDDFCGSGIAPGGEFEMITYGFQNPTGFTGDANGVPEPASLVLMLTGAAAFLRRRRK